MSHHQEFVLVKYYLSIILNYCQYLLLAECPAGCSLCNGTENTNCFACFDGSQFLDTTNKLDSPCTDSCPSDKGVKEEIDLFEKRRCVGEAITLYMT